MTFLTISSTWSTAMMENLPKNRSPWSLFGTNDWSTIASFFKTSIKLDAEELFSFAFVLDTGAPAPIYFSSGAAFNALEEKRATEEERTLPASKSRGEGSRQRNSYTHRPANIIGLPLLEQLELSLKSDKNISFAKPFVCLWMMTAWALHCTNHISAMIWNVMTTYCSMINSMFDHVREYPKVLQESERSVVRSVVGDPRRLAECHEKAVKELKKMENVDDIIGEVYRMVRTFRLLIRP